MRAWRPAGDRGVRLQPDHQRPPGGGRRVRPEPRACAIVVCALVLTVCSARAQELLDRVLAVAAGDIIMLSDVRAARELGLVDPGSAPDPDRAVLSTLIDRALILGEVDRYAPPEPDAASIDRAAAVVRTRFSSPAAYDAALARAGSDERQLHERLRQDLRIRAYLDQRFAADTPEHSQQLAEQWTAGLRRRADIVDLYEPSARP